MFKHDLGFLCGIEALFVNDCNISKRYHSPANRQFVFIDGFKLFMVNGLRLPLQILIDLVVQFNFFVQCK